MTRKVLVLLLVVVISLLVAVPALASPDGPHKEAVCHATHAGSNRYVLVYVKADQANGHPRDDTGHGPQADWPDIRPADTGGVFVPPGPLTDEEAELYCFGQSSES